MATLDKDVGSCTTYYRETIPDKAMAPSPNPDDTMKERVRAFAKEAVQSWQHYQETGLHLTGDEVQAWLSTWGTPDEIDAQECHK
jgi:predicted transcriptional regulator